MVARRALLVVAAFLAVCASTAPAQQKLGDFVTDGGYDWIIGRWMASGDEGKVEIEYKWSLDKSIVLSEMKMGDYRNRGIIMLDPDRGEVVETTADNKGGIWKGAWTEENGGLVNHVEYTTAAGEVHKGDVVYTKVDNDTVTIAMYAMDSSGSRNSEPMNRLTYKRQPASKAVAAASAERSGQATDYEKLGDLVSEGGYEWLAGKWLAEGDQQYLLEHSWTLDKHVMLMDLKLGDFAYHGMVMFVPSREEIIQVGADSMGGVWKGTWAQGDEGPTHRVEYTASDGTTRRMEHVYVRSDDDSFKVKEYVVTDGSRTSEAGRTLTFKRQKTAAEKK